MTLRIHTDCQSVAAVLDAAVADDPVRHTVLATIAQDVRNGSAGWCAQDGAAVAARSDPARPVALSEGWTVVDALVEVVADLPSLTGLGGPVDAIEATVDRLDRAVVERTEERLFRCDELRPPSGVAGRPRLADESDADLLTAQRDDFLLAAFGRVLPGFTSPTWGLDLVRRGRVWLWLDDDGHPVSHAAVRATVAGVARIGPVYTPAAHRGRGYGSAATAAATADVLGRGAVPVLFTDLANPTSNRIYQAIGFRAVCDRTAVWFA